MVKPPAYFDETTCHPVFKVVMGSNECGEAKTSVH
jgi:hypothetical protein